MNEICFTREELRDLLQISETTLRQVLARDRLKDRLKLIGFELAREEKCGRNKIYYLNQVPLTEWGTLQNYYRISEKYKKEHTEYSYARLSHVEKTKKKLMSEANMEYNKNGRQRAGNYDKILEAEEAIVRVDYEYAMYDKENNSYKQIDEETYKNFWAENMLARENRAMLRSKRTNYEISEDFYDRANCIIENQVISDNGKIAIKIVSYKEFKNCIELLNKILKHKELKA